MDALERALGCHAEGRLREAERLYREALEAEPGAVRALKGLGELLYQEGRAEQAAKCLAQAVAIQPTSGVLHAHLGEALRILRRDDEALLHLQKAISLDPASARAWNSLGLLAHQEKQYRSAESACREAIRLEPRFAVAFINLGNVLLAQHRPAEAVAALRDALAIEPENPRALADLGRGLSRLALPQLLDEAEARCRRALALAPSLPQASDSLGDVQLQRGRLEEAMASYERSLKLNPRRIAPLLGIGRVLQHYRRFDEAARYYDSARALDPRDPRPHADLGSLSFVCGRHEDAVRNYRLAVEQDPSFAEAHQGLGMALAEKGLLDEAEACLREALRIDPGKAVSWLVLARIQAERGQFDKVCQSARSALAIDPSLGEAYSRLAATLKNRMPEHEVREMKELLKRSDQSVRVRSLLHFGLAAVFDARGQFTEAAAHLEPANALQARAKAWRGLVWDADGHSRYIERIITSFTPELLERGRGWCDPDPRPVFVVGLPRSGTSLVEQILASHPRVHGAGELTELFQVFSRLPELVFNRRGDPFDALVDLSSATARRAARRYLERLDALAPSTAARVVDKLPDNVKLMGLIALLWPGARVIVCSRDLRDLAVSCWLTGFETNPWTNQWDSIAQRFADHQRLMTHWQLTRPLDWLEAPYEEIVADVEGFARRLLEFVGLEWDPACAQFHSNTRVVRTASLVQVRQPIFTHSVGRWRGYREMLQPLLLALERRGISLLVDD
jgi:tetratricopeptide (TPR) repeat protein